MSDQWKIYPCQMGPDRAWIMFDFGISKTINTEAPPRLLKIRIAFKQQPENGMPSNEEFSKLAAIDDDVNTIAQSHGAQWVGRVTVAGFWHYYVYTPEDEAAWETRLVALAKRHNHELASSIESDEKHNGYWTELYPDEASWQVIKDMEVLEHLRKNGDDGTTARRVEHWAYFPEKSDANRFAKWTGEQGYQVKPVNESQNGKFVVEFCHAGALGLVEITSRTIKLNRMAKEYYGNYDGWETPVCKGGPGNPPENRSEQLSDKQSPAVSPKRSWIRRLLTRWRGS